MSYLRTQKLARLARPLATQIQRRIIEATRLKTKTKASAEL